MTGNSLAYSSKATKQYEDKVQKLIKRMALDYERQFKQLGKQNYTADASIASQARILLSALNRKWNQVFNKASSLITDSFTSKVNKDSKKRLQNSLTDMTGLMTIKMPDMPQGMEDILKATVAENVSLIRSISSQFHDRIEGEVMRSIQSGRGTQGIFEYIKEQHGKSDKRASLIARDQTSKLTTAINRERMKSSGVRQFVWIHSGGGAEPRELHVRYDGQIFDLDDPPIIDERTGEKGLPGEAINCRCRMKPVLTF